MALSVHKTDRQTLPNTIAEEQIHTYDICEDNFVLGKKR